VSSISNTLSSSSLESILSNALQSANGTSNQASRAGVSSIGQQPDTSQLSPFAQLLSELQQLQQSDPTKYAQVTQQIATNLQKAATTATTDGNTSAATQLSTLATDFANASTSGRLPNIQDLAQAIRGGGHHRHHHSEAAPSDSDSSDTTSSSSSSTSSGSATGTNPFLASLQSYATQNDSLNPAAIILNTLSNAGDSSSNS
jgi:hypothetical protein